MSGKFVEGPMDSTEFCKDNPSTKGGPGKYDGDHDGPFGEYKRTHSPNAVPEKILDGSVPKPSGEKDQF